MHGVLPFRFRVSVCIQRKGGLSMQKEVFQWVKIVGKVLEIVAEAIIQSTDQNESEE